MSYFWQADSLLASSVKLTGCDGCIMSCIQVELNLYGGYLGEGTLSPFLLHGQPFCVQKKD